MNIHLITSKIRYKLCAGFWRGHHVHSPFVYDLVRHIINSKQKNSDIKKSVAQHRKQLTADTTHITVDDFGTGANKESRRRVCDIAKRTAITEKYGMLLARLIKAYAPTNIVELGTSLGVSTHYMALASPTARIETIEGSRQCAQIAQSAFDSKKLTNINLRTGNFGTVLPEILAEIGSPDFVFIDGNHTKEATLQYFEMCAEKASSKTILVFDDIHWSTGMSEAWQQIVDDKRVATSIDIFQFGIVFFRKGCQKEHYTVRW